MTVAPRPGRLVLLGHPVAHSLSPLFQNAALEAAGIAVRYEAVDVSSASLDDALTSLSTLQGAGNVTIPHKLAVARRCDVLTPVARRAGAVNTFRWRNGHLEGHNTDVGGFDAACTSLGVARGGAVVLCAGAGGAARAVCTATEQWPGATVLIASRRPEAAQALCQEFAHVRLAADNKGAATSTLVVNATPIGLSGDESVDPVALSAIPRDARVMDLVYRRSTTPWVTRCTAAGLVAIDGLEMLLQQGALAFAYWLGLPPDLDVMRRAVERNP